MKYCKPVYILTDMCTLNSVTFRSNDRKKLIPKKKSLKRKLPVSANDKREKELEIYMFTFPSQIY